MSPKNPKTPPDPKTDAGLSPAAKPVPDQFHSLVDKLILGAKPYARPIGIGVAALVVVVVAVTVWQGAQEKKAGQATLELGKVLDTATARVDEAGPDLEALASGQEPTPARFKTYKDRSEAELAAVAALDSSYAGANAAKSAQILAAGALYDVGKYDEAIAAYGKLLDGKPTADLAAIAREGIGYAREAKALAQTDAVARTAGLDEALKAYADIAHDEKDPLFTTALYHQARIRALKGEKQAALDLYKKIVDKDAGPLTEQVKGRMALLDAAPAPAAAPSK